VSRLNVVIGASIFSLDCDALSPLGMSTASGRVGDRWVRGFWWKEKCHGKLEYLSRCHIISQKFHIDWPGIIRATMVAARIYPPELRHGIIMTSLAVLLIIYSLCNVEITRKNKNSSLKTEPSSSVIVTGIRNCLNKGITLIVKELYS
jgi:hypothetical protein